ncbi:lactonase family protein [Reichenbachiella carrageenanivorans]|uniref:Lactonase family protein n=1 Tax=Reichenbachiella carrageenanivorans TaxID=2979869 RepID=A0ABY6CZP5_9BACT|nr:lactonase family protein [Reichenbachiella carrageenanivorans]UXX79394.1 lactonase family protein [Reichenbachiella carrageenanivorans]
MTTKFISVKSWLSIGLVLLVGMMSHGLCQPTTYLMVGSYTGGVAADGIYVYQFDSATGELTEVHREGGLVNPSFITIAPNGQYLYACTDTKLKTSGSISAFSIDTRSGKLKYINKQTTDARNPVHVTVDRDNKYVVSSNYSETSLTIFRPNTDGSLPPYTQRMTFSGKSIVSGRQEGSHLHSAGFDPTNQYLFAPDLGTDQIRAFSFAADGSLQAADHFTVANKPGSGPRHFTFSPDGRFAYCVEELSGTVSTFRYANGQWKEIDSDLTQLSPADDYASADIHISPDGLFLYASNRAELNNISIFKIDQTNGTLSLLTTQPVGGKHPRSFVIDPSGQFLISANQNSGNLVVFKRDTNTGLLTQTATEIQVNSPSSLKMITYQN